MGDGGVTKQALHGDHGYQLGERNIYCKETCFNLATHVPLMIRVPGQNSTGRTSQVRNKETLRFHFHLDLDLDFGIENCG